MTTRILNAVQRMLLFSSRSKASREAQLRFNVFMSREINLKQKNN